MERKLLLILLILICGCNNFSEPIIEKEFSGTEIQYHKYGGWINTSRMIINDKGKIAAYLISQAALDTLKKGFSSLKSSEENELHEKFSSFSDYESNYSPNKWYTDGNYHTVIYMQNGLSDTVSVYEIQNSNIPEELRIIIDCLENLWYNTVNQGS